MLRYIGLDFGTHSSGIGLYTNQLLVANGFPTVLYFPPFNRNGNLDIFFGEEAIEASHEDPGGRLMFAIKTLAMEEDFMGQSIQGYMGIFDAVRLIRLCLIRIKEIATARFSLDPEKLGAVIGRPVDFPDFAIARLVKAATEAGFKDVQLEPEPIAAARAVQLHIDRTPATACIIDAGGGTTDIAVVRFDTKTQVSVLSTAGINLAGNHINSNIIQSHLLEHFGKGSAYGDRNMPVPMIPIQSIADWRKMQAVDVRVLAGINYNATNPEAVSRLIKLYGQRLGYEFYCAVGSAKEALSTCNSTTIACAPLELTVPIQLSETAQYSADITDAIVNVIKKALSEARITSDEVHCAVLTGGTGLFTPLQRKVKQLFGENKVRTTDPFNTVVGGLALKAYELTYSQRYS